MISIKDQVAEFLTRVSSFRRNLDDVVEDDECMALMARKVYRAFIQANTKLL
jgi:hypothetical protein